MAEAAIMAPVIEQSVAFVFGHTYQELQYLWKFNRNIQTLNSTMTDLETRRATISLQIDAAKNNAEIIGPDVVEWMQQVELMKTEVDEIKQETRNAQMGCCFNCKCPNLKVRYSLSKKAAIKIIEIADLQGKGEFSRVGYPAPIGQRTFTSPMDVVGFESRLIAEKRVMKALLDENIPVIALCGMGGVGKTTLVKKIADEVKKDKHFDEAVMAVVSREYDPKKVQQVLAEKLRLEMKETDVDARADRLHARLMDQGKRILLIIDDLWEEIKLGDIGIPNRKGLKVIVTSRLREECSKMDIKKIIEVEVLHEEESWGLFKKHANITDDDSDRLDGIPKKMADKCQGLPLAIEVIGKTLKDRKQLFEWRDALKILNSAQDSDSPDNKVYASIKWSIDYLGRQHRSLLLLCSLFPEDSEIEVEDLVRYAKGLQFLESIELMVETRDRVGAIINVLMDCYLLIACNNNRVKLHDVVRDTCLRIASDGENVFMVSHSGLKEWPYKETYKSYTAISLDFDYLNGRPSGLNCSRLQFLMLKLDFDYHNRHRSINLTGLLEATGELRVLHITSPDIELPLRSLQTSMSLRTLNLHYCPLKGDLSTLLKSLLKVEVLSFFHSYYEGKWPKEIAQLSNLKSLDLRFGKGPGDSFPTGILIHLKKLEELYLGSYKKFPEIISESRSLSNLNTIYISSVDSHCLGILVDNLDVDRLSRFYICATVETRLQYNFSGTMIVRETNMGTLLEPKMKALLTKVDGYLHLDGVTGFNNGFDGLSVFCRSRKLILENCEMKYMCNNTSNSVQGVFVDLKTLIVKGANHLEELCHGNIPPQSFARMVEVFLKKVPLLRCLFGPIKPPCLGNLTWLTIHDGKVITSLFLLSSVKCFTRLRVITIKSCPKLETIVSFDGQIENDTVEGKPDFPELEEIHLEDVNSFKTFCSEPEVPTTVFMRNTKSNIFPFPKLRILKISGFSCLHVCNDIMNGHNLSSLKIDNSDSLEVCFDFERFCKEITDVKVAEREAFDNLGTLTLDKLPKLRHLLKNLPEGTVAFKKLTKLFISNCGSLKYLLTPSMASMLVSLKDLEISDCEKLEAIVGSKELGASKEFSASNILDLQEGTVAFKKLTNLYISNCGSLKHLFTPSMAKILASLETLKLIDCKELEVIVRLDEKSPLERIFDQLVHLVLRGLPRFVNFRRMLPEGTVAFPKLVTLTIHTCNGLRYLLTPPMVKMFPSLEDLQIDQCYQMESIIGSEEDDQVAEKIQFPELCELTLKNLPKLRMFCSQPVDLSLPYWNKFVLYGCPRIIRFCAGNMIAPELKQVTFLKYSDDYEIDFDLDFETTLKWFKDCELGKRCIDCARLGEEVVCDHLSVGSSDQYGVDCG